MSSRKATFYIDDNHRSFVENFRSQRGLKSPSEAVRKIIEEAEKRPSDNEAELTLLADVLRQNTARAKAALAEAFNEIQSTRRYLAGNHESH